MKSRQLILLLIPALFLILGARPEKKQFYKGNMHTHSYWSDGDTYPEEVAWWFKNNGYQFLAVTDHNILQQGDKWINADRNETFRKNYENYLEHFGGVGLQTEKRDGALHVKLRTLEEYRDQFEVAGEFLLVNSEEVTDASEGKPVHLNAINVTEVIKPTKGEPVGECLTMNVDRMRSGLAASGNPEWIIVNHPNFGWALTGRDLALCGARFFEVFNGHPSVHNYGDAEHPGTEEMWDEANRIRCEKGLPLLLGVANDDSHHYLEFAVGRANPGRGYSMVRAAALAPEALYQAMNTGDFYASTGVELKDFAAGTKTYSLKIAAEKGVSYTTSFIALMKGEEQSRVVSTVVGTKATYKITGNEVFVRARVDSDKVKENPFSEGDHEVAWLQPVKVN